MVSCTAEENCPDDNRLMVSANAPKPTRINNASGIKNPACFGFVAVDFHQTELGHIANQHLMVEIEGGCVATKNQTDMHGHIPILRCGRQRKGCALRLNLVRH